MTHFSLLPRSSPRVRRLTAKEAYEALAPHYDSIPNPMMALEQNAMARLLPDLEGLTVADLGCGTGRYTERALDAGARRVYAVDLSHGMLRHLSSRVAADPRVREVRANMEQLPFAAGRLDGVLSGLALGYATRLDRVLAEMSRVLRPGGFALISDLHPVGPSLGWQREYLLGVNGNRERIVVEHHAYSFERFFELVFAHGLFLNELQEVPVGEGVMRFAHGWRERRRVHRLRNVPAVAVFLLSKED